MAENEFKGLLDRHKSTNDAQSTSGETLALLRDITNYGTNLIPRAFGSSDRGMGSIITICVLLKQVVSMIDAVEILVSKGHTHAGYLAYRAAYEASIYVDWMLQGETDKKARYYYVSNLRRQRLWARRMVDGTAENISFTPIVDRLSIDFKKTNPAIEREAKDSLSQIDKVLSQESFSTINSEFEKLTGKRQHRVEPDWYRPLKITSIRQMAEAVNRLPEYEMFYATGSQVTHAASYRDHIEFNNKRVRFKPIRHLEHVDTLLQITISLAFSTYRSVLSFYRTGELTNFSRKYVNEWQASFKNVKKVNYRSAGETLI